MNKDISTQSHIGGLKNYHRVRQRKTPGLGISALLVVGVLILFSVPIQASEFAFSQETYYAFEDSGSAILTVDRVKCEGSSLDDEVILVIREDVSLTWGPGDCSSKSFEEPILNDTIVGNDESIELQFVDPFTEEIVSTTLMIEDNDAQSLQDYSVEQIRELTSNDLDSRKDEFKQLSSKDFSRISTNLDKNKVTPADVQEILPNGWTIDLNTGEMTALEGDKLTLNILKKAPTGLSNKITLPVNAANLNAGFGVGGMGKPVIEELEESLGFNITQDTYGSVVTAEVGGTEYIVIPNQDNITQVAVGTPALSIAEGGFYSLTTADGLQIQVSPAPEPLALSEALDDGAVTLGKHGDTLMEIPQDEFDNAVQTRKKKRRKGRTVAISKYSRRQARSGLSFLHTPNLRLSLFFHFQHSDSSYIFATPYSLFAFKIRCTPFYKSFVVLHSNRQPPHHFEQDYTD
jgi:hypothetical protein